MNVNDSAYTDTKPAPMFEPGRLYRDKNSCFSEIYMYAQVGAAIYRMIGLTSGNRKSDEGLSQHVVDWVDVTDTVELVGVKNG